MSNRQTTEQAPPPPDAGETTLQRIFRQFSRFTLVGGAGTAIHYGVMALLIEASGVRPIPASATGFITSAVVSYLLNYRITFSSAMDHRKALPMFLLVGTVGLGLNSVLLGALTGWLRLHWIPAQMIASAIVLCWNFAANKRWTFTASPRSGSR